MPFLQISKKFIKKRFFYFPFLSYITHFTMFAILAVLIIPSASWSATFYVDATNGNDQNDGFSESTAWKTIAKVNSSQFQPGDFIFFKRGEIWRKQLIPSSSGSSGNPITFGAYGSGNKPKITTTTVISGLSSWSSHSTISNVYGISWGGDGNAEILKDGMLRLNAPGNSYNQETNLSDHEWTYSNTDGKYYYRDTSGSPENSGVLLEIALANYSIYVNNKSYLVFENLEVYGAASSYPAKNATFRIINSDNITVTNCIIYLAEHYALSTSDSTNILFSNNEVFFAGAWCIDASGKNGNNITISSNTVHHCGNTEQDDTDGHGIGISSASNVIVELNDIHANGSGGNVTVGNMNQAVVFWGSVNSIIRRNKIHDNFRGGIGIQGPSTNCEVSYNLVYNNGLGGPADSGAWHTGIGVSANGDISANHKIFNNVIFNNNFTNSSSNDGAIRLLSGNNASVSVSIKNNIIYNNIDGYELSRGTWNGGTISADLDHNIYYRTGGGNIIRWIGGVQDWNTYHNSNGNEPNSLNKNPLFVSDSIPDFHLLSNSPAIDAGVDVGLTGDYTGNYIEGEPDIGAFEYDPSYLPPVTGLRIN